MCQEGGTPYPQERCGLTSDDSTESFRNGFGHDGNCACHFDPGRSAPTITKGHQGLASILIFDLSFLKDFQ